MKELVTIEGLMQEDKEEKFRSERAKELRTESVQAALIADLAEKDAAHYASYVLARANILKQQVLAGITKRPENPPTDMPDIIKEILYPVERDRREEEQ